MWLERDLLRLGEFGIILERREIWKKMSKGEFKFLEYWTLGCLGRQMACSQKGG